MFGKVNQTRGGRVEVVSSQKDNRFAEELNQEESGTTRFFTTDDSNALVEITRALCAGSHSTPASPPGGEARSASAAPSLRSEPSEPKLVVWITARATELAVARQVISDRYGIEFERRQTASGLNYHEGSNAEWRFRLSFARRQGPVDMGPHVLRVLTDFRAPAPYMAVMSGVCAARRGAVALGDLIAVQSAFTMVVGGKVVIAEGQTQQRSATDMHGTHSKWSPVFEELAHEFNNWDKNMPLNKTYQQECYTRLMIEIEQQRRGKAPTRWFQATGYDILREPRDNCDALQRLLPSYPASVDCWELGDDGFYQPPAEMHALVAKHLRACDYPPKPRGPKCHYVPVLTDVSVRADDARAFEEAGNVHRDTNGLDMEASVFYQNCRDILEKTPYLVTKGVVDHADMEKDNQFHEYGNRMAAVFLLDAIEHVSTIAYDSA